MKQIFKVIGAIMYFGAGLFMFIFWFGAMTNWLGCFGSVLALICCPGLVIFPIIFWIVEGVFPVVYFTIWGLGIAGMIIAGLAGLGSED